MLEDCFWGILITEYRYIHFVAAALTFNDCV